MAGLISLLLSFPSVVFSALLTLCLLYWLLVIAGVADIDALSIDTDAEAGAGAVAALLTVLGVKGVPATIVFSLLVFFAWTITAVVDLNLLSALPPMARALVGVPLLIGAAVAAMALTRLCARPLRGVFAEQGEAAGSRDLVGRVCTVSSGSVDARWGEARVTLDGTELVLKVYTRDTDPLKKNDTVLIVEYDEQSDRYRVCAFDQDPMAA